jgi:serine/threonine-protein kinase PknK
MSTRLPIRGRPSPTGTRGDSAPGGVTINGRFTLLRGLGVGASSTVFAVHERSTDAARAIKLLHEDADEELMRGEFARLSALEHANLVRVHDLDRLQHAVAFAGQVIAAGRLFLVMDLVEGVDPVHAIARAPVGERDALLRRIAADLAGALAHVHGHGLVHHDVKPDNLLLTAAGRAVLIDLGLATRPHQAWAGRGTLPYLAPEALGGGGDQRVDLYGIGATLYALAAGRPPFGGKGGALVQQILQQQPTLDAPWLSREIGELILRLLRKDPLERPASARSVLAELARLRGDARAVAELSARPELLPPPFVGREELLDRLQQLLEQRAAPRVVLLVGKAGTGKTRLVLEATRRQRIRAAAGIGGGMELVSGVLRDVLRQLAPPAAVSAWCDGEETTLSVDDLAAQAADLLHRRAAERQSLVVHLPDLDADPVTRRLVEMVQRSAMTPARTGEDPEDRGARPVLLLAEAASVPSFADHGAVVLEVGPLDDRPLRTLVAAMLGGSACDPDDARQGAAQRIGELSRGNPALTVELTRLWYQHGDPGLDLERLEGLDPLVERGRQRLAPSVRAVADALAVWGQPATAAELARLLLVDIAEVWPALHELATDGTIQLQGRQAALPSAAHLGAWRRAQRGRCAELHQRAAALLEQQTVSDLPRLAEQLLAAGDPRAVAIALRAGRELAAAHDPQRAAALLEEAMRREPGAAEALEVLGDLYLQLGRYEDALRLLEGHEGPLALRRAQALQRRGDYAEAEQLLLRCIPQLGAEEDRRRATALLARLMLQQARAGEALRLAGPALEPLLAGGALSAGGAALLEAVGLAHYYAGDLAAVDRLFAQGEGALEAADRSRRARFVSYRGMAALAADELGAALGHYRRALELARQAGDVHGQATYEVNLGSTLLMMGQLGEALSLLSAAIRDLERLGRTVELASALCNLANLLLLFDDVEQAAPLLVRARQLGGARVEGYLCMLEGDLLRRQGAAAAAAERYLEAQRRFAATEARRELLLGRLAQTEALLEAGRTVEARERLADLGEEARRDGGAALAWARLHLADRATPLPEGTERRIVEHCADLERRGARKDLWRAAAVLGRLLLALGQRSAAKEALGRARNAWEVIVSESPEIYRERMGRDADARTLVDDWQALLTMGHDAEVQSAPGAAAYDAQWLRRLLSINKRLNSELRLPRLLELIMDTVIELTNAERGFLLLAERDGALSIKVARNIDRRSLEGAELALSRSIAEKAARTGEPVVTVDAAADGRFQEAMSVSSLNLRSVLAAPLTVKGRVVGTVYIDSRLRQGLFGEAEVRLVQDVADQAAIAIDNARLLLQNRRRKRRIERLNERLQLQVESQQTELLEVREELRSSKQALQVRYDYHNIVGRTPRILELFQLLDRVTETELPVVIQGDSGTGKELVARAIHYNGRRSERPFVTENCAAIPETLLESVLFGHVRGAFTGADRDRKGLFEVASGGTLFLDEVGEMSAAMQTKLLRVLQNGEFRRVGGTQTLKTDVRVLAASNKDLSRLVSEGRFREDLFYRLNVIQIQIPALKDRREDIPLLVDHFLQKHAPDGGRRVSPEAMALLAGYGWPGNVRELENEVMRAAALGSKVIQARELSPQVRGTVPLAISGADDLTLRTRVEHLERELIERAMGQTGGNHTQAARLLGLSRFGLLKKMRRYAEANPPRQRRKGKPTT